MILDELCDLDLWAHPWPWPWIFEVKFWNNCALGIVCLIDVKRKGSKSIRHSTDYVTLPFDHTVTLKFEIVLFQEWGAYLT